VLLAMLATRGDSDATFCSDRPDLYGDILRAAPICQYCPTLVKLPIQLSDGSFIKL